MNENEREVVRDAEDGVGRPRERVYGECAVGV